MMKRPHKVDEDEKKKKLKRPDNYSDGMNDSEMRKELEEFRKAYKELRKREEEKNRELEEKDKFIQWQALLFSLNDFIGKNLSTTLQSSPGLVGRHTVINLMSLSKFMELANIPLLDPLDEREWNDLCQDVQTVQDDTKSERAGVHPVVLQVVKSLMLRLPGAEAWKYRACYEHLAVDDELIEKEPDISIKLADVDSSTMSDVVVPVEIKSKDHIVEAMRQSLGYLAVKLRDQLEISQNQTSRLFGYCVGTDGHTICMGKIEIENYNFSVSTFNDDAIPFWEPDMQ